MDRNVLREELQQFRQPTAFGLREIKATKNRQ
jgi:hypothetical protein